MAVKNHQLDQRIIDAAMTEFMEKGYKSASVHKIAARAGITTGALYTRYAGKDDLFCSLIIPAMKEMEPRMVPVQALYGKAQEKKNAQALLEAIRAEEALYLDLLFSHYEACTLFFCKSEGSTIYEKLQALMEEKSCQTVNFFRSIAKKEIDFDGINLLITQQFSYYRQILMLGYSKEKAIACLQVVDDFLEAGWKSIFDKIL